MRSQLKSFHGWQKQKNKTKDRAVPQDGKGQALRVLIKKSPPSVLSLYYSFCLF
jgi:hypothetical protein